MRFVIFKGTQGFGDRLQCLLQVIRYARATNRFLVLDWRDSDWTHDLSINTNYYFDLKNVPTFGIDEFFAYYAAHKHALRVFPNIWRDELESPLYTNWIYNKAYWTDPENELLDFIATFQRQDVDAEVVVYCGVGKRSFTYADAGAIQPARWIEDRIRDDFTKWALKARQYGVIHLRGGSKSWAGGYVPLRDLREKINTLWPSQESYLESIYSAYKTVPTALPDLDKSFRTVLLSDSSQLCEAWRQKYGMGEVLETYNKKVAESGLHKLSKAELQEITPSLNKVEMNYQLLRDFTLMLNARFTVGDGVSLFSEMAQKCALAGVHWIDF